MKCFKYKNLKKLEYLWDWKLIFKWIKFKYDFLIGLSFGFYEFDKHFQYANMGHIGVTVIGNFAGQGLLFFEYEFMCFNWIGNLKFTGVPKGLWVTRIQMTSYESLSKEP